MLKDLLGPILKFFPIPLVLWSVLGALICFAMTYSSVGPLDTDQEILMYLGLLFLGNLLLTCSIRWFAKTINKRFVPKDTPLPEIEIKIEGE